MNRRDTQYKTKEGKADKRRDAGKPSDGRSRIPAARKSDGVSALEPDEFQEGQEVELLISDRTEIGYKATINNAREGLLYKNEVFQPLRKGQHVAGFIKKVREDGKIDLCLQKPGPENVDAVSERILARLNSHGGFIPLDDKSPPELIYRLFGTSKKTFKKALGALYKKRLIIIESAGIRLAKKDATA